MNKNIQKEKCGISGLITARVFNTTSKKAQTLEKEIEMHCLTRWNIINKKDQENHYKVYKQMVSELKRLFQVKEYQLTNLITTVGRSVIAQRLANTTTYTGIIDDGALGSNATTPVNANTQLGTEIYRKIFASNSFTDNVAFIDWFYLKTDTNGTYEEFGTFIDGDGTGNPNTGQMFTHALTDSWVKTASESMTVSAQYNIT